MHVVNIIMPNFYNKLINCNVIWCIFQIHEHHIANNQTADSIITFTHKTPISMSSFFKKWNTKKTPTKGNKEKPDGKSNSANFEDEDNYDLPPSAPRRPDRNLSISRSGRHKVRRQRASVTDDLYSPDGTPNRQGAPTTRQQTQQSSHWSSSSASRDQTVSGSGAHVNTSATSGGGGGSYHCRETVDQKAGNLSGSQRGMARAPTAV